MALLSIANLVLSFGERRILDGVNLTLDAGQHVGMVGRNGCGKSTLMKLAAGLVNIKPDSGQVQLARGATAGYLTQDPDLDPNRTLREEAATAFARLHELHDELEKVAHDMASAQGPELDRLMKKYEQVEHQVQAAGGYAVDHQIDATLHGLGLTDEFFDVKVADLSGGQKGRLALAKLLLTGPDLLLLDEPTNHLDIVGRQWLEEFLASYRGAVMIVSHDRWLLDRVVSKIYELEAGRMVEYPGNYGQYRELRAVRQITQTRDYQKQQERIRSEQAFIDRYRAGQRARQAQGREKRLERFKEESLIERPVEMDAIGLRFRPATRCGDLVVTAEELEKTYENKPLFRGLNLVIKRGDRVGIIGPNGAGKSTLIRCLLGEQPADKGKAKVGASVDVGHYKQTHEHLDLKLTVVDYLRKFVATGTEQEARDLSGAFLFSGNQQDKPMAVLSGGERSRAVLAALMVGGHNLLVLDEPTNHLDIPSAERLEDALRQFTAPLEGFGQSQTGGGTLILITHDRMLLEDLVDQLLILDGKGHCRHFLGKYSQYVAAQQAQVIAESEPARSKPQPAGQGGKQAKPVRQEAGKGGGKPAGSSQGHGALSKLAQESLEKKIVDLEARLAKADEQLADPEIYRDGPKVKNLQAQRQKIRDELTPLEEEWARRAQA